MRRFTDIRFVDDDSTPPYRVIRRHILRRDHGTCQICGALADEVDHIWPLRHGGDDRESNLQAVCGTCNKRKGDTVDWDAATPGQIFTAARTSADRLERESALLDDLVRRFYARSSDMEWAGGDVEELTHLVGRPHSSLQHALDLLAGWAASFRRQKVAS